MTIVVMKWIRMACLFGKPTPFTLGKSLAFVTIRVPRTPLSYLLASSHCHFTRTALLLQDLLGRLLNSLSLRHCLKLGCAHRGECALLARAARDIATENW